MLERQALEVGVSTRISYKTVWIFLVCVLMKHQREDMEDRPAKHRPALGRPPLYKPAQAIFKVSPFVLIPNC